MIRDLQYESRRVKEIWRRRVRVSFVLILLACIAGGVVSRELHIQRQYDSIPDAKPGDRESIERRLASLDALIEGNPLWLGMFRASGERGELRVEVERLYAREAELARLKADERAEHEIAAETAVVRARQRVQNLDFEGAVEHYEEALETAPEDWAERGRVESDLAAVREHLEEGGR